MARRVISQIDRPLLVVVVLLSALGLYNLASAARTLNSHVHLTQAIFLAVGFIVMGLVASVDYRNLEGLAAPIFLGVIVLLVATLLFGKVVNGSKRWLPLGPVNMQTSDLAKLSVLLIIARVLSQERSDHQLLTLDAIFRPFNLSRPVAVVVGVLVLSTAGDALSPGELKRPSGGRMRRMAQLSGKRPLAELGRAKDARVRLAYPGIEAHHAEVERVEEGNYVLRDLGSASGTFVNGHRIEGSYRLHDGDVVRLGLNPRAELAFSSKIERLKPILPAIAIFGALWLFVAMYLQFKRGRFETKDLMAPIDLVAVPCLLVLVQPDLGTSLVIILIAFSIILFVGLRPLSLFLLTVFSAASGVLAWFFVLKPYQKQRVVSFLNPTSDLAGSGYHQHQSLIAIGSGQMYGKGYRQGTQTQFSFLPEQQTDFIFSVWAEEQGFVGCAIVVLLFLAFFLLSYRLARQAKDKFGALLVIGASALIFWHTVVNMLMVLRLAPVVGVPLPLWSYGGSFLMTAMISLGIIFSVSARRYVF